MSQLRYRELLALLRHPLVPLDADVEVVVRSEPEPLTLGTVADLLNQGCEFSEEKLDAWLGEVGVQYDVSINVDGLLQPLRMSDPL